jgi:hypothetical protein
MPDFMKIRAVGAELFHADGRTDGQTDVTKLTVGFRDFVNAPKNCHWIICMLRSGMAMT